KLALERVDPVLRDLVWGVSCTRRYIEKEWPIGSDALDLAHPADGMVGEVGGQVVVWITGGRDEVPVLVEHRVPVVHVAAVETIEIIEPEPVSPTIEWPGCASFPNRRVVVLADPRCHVAVLSKDLAHRSCTVGQDGGVAVISCGRFADHTGGRGVVVATSDERGPRRAAQRGRVEAIVSEPLRRKLVHRWRWDAAAEGAELAEASVV